MSKSESGDFEKNEKRYPEKNSDSSKVSIIKIFCKYIKDTLLFIYH
jgi:hypothetical protein